MVIPLTIQHFDILPSNRVHSKLRVRNFSVYDINKYTNGAMSEQPKPDLSHHKQLEYCTNRLKYRDGHRQTAVKVYTITNESKHLLVFGVPRINLVQEVKQLFGRTGRVSKVNVITDNIATNKTVEVEIFTDCYHVVYEHIRSARKAKLIYDRKTFYGGILHVSYAPEYESLADLREKFAIRKRDVGNRLRLLRQSPDQLVEQTKRNPNNRHFKRRKQ